MTTEEIQNLARQYYAVEDAEYAKKKTPKLAKVTNVAWNHSGTDGLTLISVRAYDYKLNKYVILASDPFDEHLDAYEERFFDEPGEPSEPSEPELITTCVIGDLIEYTGGYYKEIKRNFGHEQRMRDFKLACDAVVNPGR